MAAAVAADSGTFRSSPNYNNKRFPMVMATARSAVGPPRPALKLEIAPLGNRCQFAFIVPLAGRPRLETDYLPGPHRSA